MRDQLEVEPTGDECRESDLTPGEVRAEYTDLNGQIITALDSYVEVAQKAADKLEALLPFLSKMQRLLSQRGPQRKLMDTVGLPTWQEWFEDFRPRIDLSLRTIQRKLREWRDLDGEAPATPKDINVVARESIRAVESKRQAEKLDAVVEAKDELNPAIRAEVIRAYRAKGEHYLALADELEKGFTPLPVAQTGKAHQRLVREQRAKLPDPLLEEKLKLAADFSKASVREITYDEAKNVIYANEYLGTMPGGVIACYGLFFGEYLGAVEVFGSTAGTKVNQLCGPEHTDKVAVQVRGATEHWAHKNSGSHLISRACDLMATKHGKNIFVAYSDPAGGEVGQIYAAANFNYCGMIKGTEVFITPDGKRHNTRAIHGMTRDRRNGELNYKRTRAEQKKLLIEEGCKFQRVGGKHKWVHFAGDKRTRRMLRKALRWSVLAEHPRRDAQAVAASA